MVSLFKFCVALIFFYGVSPQDLENHNVYKRETMNITTYTVKLLIVADYSIYQNWVEEVQTVEVDDQIFRHYGNVVNEMNSRYRSIQGRLSIDIDIADIIILKNRTESLWIEKFHNRTTLDATRTLKSFREWRQTAGGLSVHDHAMLFTWYDLYKDGSDSVAGLAYTRTMCTRSSVSIVEDRVYGQTFHVAAHELAHSLGSRHDGNGNSCSSEDNYIMSDTKKVSGNVHSNRNSWKFSECTSEYFSEFIKELDEERANCLVVKTGSSDAVTNPTAVTSFAPSPDTQCAMMQGNGSHLCRHFYKRNYTDFCALMFCSSNKDSTCQFRLPVDGTQCGYNKKCYEGYCVGDAAASDAKDANYSDDCLFGDQPGVLYETNKGCPNILTSDPYKCYEEESALRCCQTCKTLYTGVKGCEYGDKEPMCKTATRFHCLLHGDTCCGYCKDFSKLIIKVVVPAGVGFLIVMVIIILYCRYCCKRRKTSKKPGKDSDNQVKDDNDQTLDQIDNAAPAMNGFRVAGSRHQPMFQYDRVAQLAALTTNQHLINNIRPYEGIYNNGFVNDLNRNPTMMTRNDYGFSKSTSLDQNSGNNAIMPSYTSARHNFDLRKFGEGPYSWSIG